MKRSWLKWMLVSAALGLLAPILWFAVLTLFQSPKQWKVLQVIMVAWPSSVFLMATDGIEGTLEAGVIIFGAIAINVALYALLGGGVWWLKNTLASLKHRA